MTDNFQPSEDIFDDVEGHVAKFRGIETPETDDVEGHGFRGYVVPPEDDDVEGHGARASH